MKDAYWGRAAAYSNKFDHQKALSDFNKFLELDPQNRDGYFSRGMTHWRAKDQLRAIEDFNKAKTLGLNSYDLFFARGACYHELKRDDWALADFGRAVAIDPQRYPVYMSIGNIHHVKMQTPGDPDWWKSLRAYEKFLSLAPASDPSVKEAAKGIAGLKKWRDGR